MGNDRKGILQALQLHDKFALLGHLVPDGDAIGSVLALSKALKSLGKEADPFFVDQIPSVYAFLPGVPNISKPPNVLHGYPVVIYVDCADIDRAGPIQVEGASLTINLDHHISNKLFGSLNYVDPLMSATGEIAFEFIKDLGVDISTAIATCIYTAIYTDTGSFQYENTTSSSMMVAAQMIEAGVSPSLIAERIHGNRSKKSLDVLGFALSTLRLSGSGKVAWMTLTSDDMKSLGVTEDDTEGIVNYARTIDGVEIGIFFKQVDEGRIKVAFRSRHYVDVSALAVNFGGGGHPRAAGCTIYSNDVQQVVTSVIEMAERACVVGYAP